MTSWNCQPGPGETGRSPCKWARCQADRWPGLLAAQSTLDPSSVFPEDSWPNQECQGGCLGDGSGCNMDYPTPALSAPFTPTCNALSEGGKTSSLSTRKQISAFQDFWLMSSLDSLWHLSQKWPNVSIKWTSYCKVKKGNKIAKPMWGLCSETRCHL